MDHTSTYAWYDLTDLQTDFATYRRKYGRSPDRVFCHPADYADLRGRLPQEVSLATLPSIQKRTIYVEVPPCVSWC